MRLATGSTAPPLQSSDYLGTPVELAQLRGKAVLVSFYRYASCPICNLRVHELIVAHPTLRDLGLEMIAVFQSPAAVIADYVGTQHPPFSIVPDPELALYRRFRIESRLGAMLSWQVIRRAFKAFASGFRPGRVDGPFGRVPADFLIDADGQIAIAHYGENIDDHLAIAAIEAWLRENPALRLAA